MIAAIYARKSNEQLGADEQRSVARQIAHARKYAARKGWTVDDRYGYVDDGISGAEFARRPARWGAGAAPADCAGGAVAGGARQDRDGAVVDEPVPGARLDLTVSAARPRALRVVQWRRYYACTSHYLRGPSVCANKVQVPMEAVDRAVLGSIRELLTPDIAHHVLTRVHELVDAQVASDPRAPIAAELADICARLVNLAKAIAACGSLPEFIEDAQALEARRQRLIELLVSRESARASEHTASRLAVLESHAYQMLD